MAKAKTKISKTEINPPYKTVNNFLDKASLLGKFRSSKAFYIVLLVIGILLLTIFKKNWFVAAIVDNMPITNLELQSRLNRDYRSQVLNQLVAEKIILTEAAKNNAVATEPEVTSKISEIETTVGGAQALDALLNQQGQTRESIRQPLKIKLSIEKLYSNEATVSAAEVEKFIEQNKDFLKATDSAGQEKEALVAIKEQKITQISSQKLQEIRQKAKVTIF